MKKVLGLAFLVAAMVGILILGIFPVAEGTLSHPGPEGIPEGVLGDQSFGAPAPCGGGGSGDGPGGVPG